MPDRPMCFLIAPIGDEGTDTRTRSDRVLRYLVEPAAEECGYQAVRADKISRPGIITVQVIQAVINAPMVVADLTEHNANAFYELAIRHMVKKPLVQMIKKGEKIPFDVAATRVLIISDPDLDTIEDAKSQLVEHLKAAKEDASQVDNPISISTDLQALRQSADPQQTQLAHLAGMLSASVASIRSDIADLKRQLTDPLPPMGSGSLASALSGLPTIDPAAIRQALEAIRYNVQSASPTPNKTK